MRKNKVIEYSLIMVICIISILTFFLPNIKVQKYVITAFILSYTVILIKIVGFKKIDNVSKKRVITLITSLSFMYIIIIYFVSLVPGYYKNSDSFSLVGLFTNILPYVITVICSEIIRQTFLLKNNKKTTIVMTFVLVLIEILMHIDSYAYWEASRVVELVGFIIFPAISTGLLCNHMVKKYGIIPNIVYRVITTIYWNIFGYLPNIYMFFQSIYKLTYPYIVYLILNEYFEPKGFKRVLRNRRIKIVSLLISIIMIIIIIMLISCQFKYGILVVGSSSMAGEINKGDAVVYERFDKQDLQKGQVIIFIKNDIKTIHKIESVQIKNDEKMYLTKGTNNMQQDEGYRTEKDIIGVVKFKIVCIGWPTIWVNELFNK